MNFTKLFENDIIAIFPEIYLTISILGLLVFGVIYSKEEMQEISPSPEPTQLFTRTIAYLSVLSILIAILLILNQPFTTIILLKNLLIQDSFTTLIKTIVLLSCAGCLLISFQYLKEEKILSFEYNILILLATLGMILIVSSYDLLSMYLAIELQSLSLYVLAAFQRTTEQSTEAGLKYFLLGAFSSGILLFGCSLVYGFTGTTNLGELAKLLSESSTAQVHFSGISIGLIFITVALLFKVAAAPFHMWAPDVYEGAPTSVTAFFAIVPKIAIMGLLARLCFFTFYPFLSEWQDMIILSAMISMLVGSITGLYQDKIKRLLAYSSIGHVGYILVGVATGSFIGIQALLLYLSIYIVMSLNMFGIILSLRKQQESNGVTTAVTYLEDFRQLSSKQPLAAIMLTLSLFSLAGIPPLAGFYSKWYIFTAAIHAKLYLLAIVGVVTSVIGSVYYIRIIKLMYFDSAEEKQDSFIRMSPESSFIISFTSMLIVAFFLYPSPLFVLTHKATVALCL